MAGVLERIHRANRPAFHSLSPKQARIAYLMGAEILDLPRAPLPRVENLQLPGEQGCLNARLYAPSTEVGLPVLLYFHGGGFTIGSLETHDSLCRQLALRSGAAVISLDYRLAPEHRFPAAVDDCWAVLRWLAASAQTLGLDPARIAVGGDSAGGTLAAALAIAARDDQRHPRPLLQLLAYPGLSAWQDAPSHRTFGKGYLLERDTIQWFFRQYLRGDADRGDWRFAPLEAPSLAGVAPALILLPEFDPLVDEGRAYAEKLRRAGVPVDLLLYPGMIHEFLRMGNVVDTARDALTAIAARLAAAFRGGPEMPGTS